MYYGLVDCNNFFVSCERLFNPELEGKPVVVLSNNDGCAISRSNEAKALGIPMGCPAFKIKDIPGAENVIAISSNHVLYSDISHRIMSILGKEVDSLQVYSVDEAFFKINCADAMDAECECAALAEKIRRSTGIPVSVGIASTKTLAKIASHIAKKRTRKMVHTLLDRATIERELRLIAVDDVWGIGRRISEKLHRSGVYSAYDFTRLPSSFIKSVFNINVERTRLELLGESVAEISPIDDKKQSITTSRSFGRLVADRVQLSDAIVAFASNCCKLLRSQNSVAGSVYVAVRGDINVPSLPFYSNCCEMKLQYPTCSTMEIVNNALIALDNIFKEGFYYKKAGVTLCGIRNAEKSGMGLFEAEQETKQRRLMSAIDSINATGDVVSLAADAAESRWHPRKEHKPKRSEVLRFYSGMILPKKT